MLGCLLRSSELKLGGKVGILQHYALIQSVENYLLPERKIIGLGSLLQLSITAM